MSSQYPILDNRPIDQWKVTELKEELKRRRLTTTGLKADLIKRLDEAIFIEKENAAKLAEMENAAKLAEMEKAAKDADNGFECGDESVVGSKDAQSVQVAAETDNDLADDSGKKNKNKNADDVTVQVDINESAATLDQGKVEESDMLGHIDSSRVEEEMVVQTTTVETSIEVTETVVSEVVLSGQDLENVETHEENGNLKSQLENDDLKSHLESEESKPQLESEESKPKLESEESKPQLENEESKPQLENEESKPQLENEESKPQLENESLNPPSEGVMLDLSTPDNQVSEVSPILGFQVKSDSISTDSVSINETIELKDNVIADHVNLELDVVKPEMVEPSSSHVVPVGGESHPMDVEEPHENKASDGGKDSCNATDADINKKIDSADVGYSEKLNLDRSSGDDSMEEDVLESKQIDSKYNSEEVEIKIEKSHVVKEESHVAVLGDALSAEKKEVHVESKSHPAAPAEKRKFNDQPAVGNSEPIKRQRRWNSEGLKVPEPQSTNSTPTTTPKDTFQSAATKRNFSRSDSTNSEDTPKERVVPPSPKSPTNSLRIDRFLRPFTLKAVQELLGKTGSVTSFWMDHIKTHCYVTYSSVQEAVETRNAVFNLQWPPNGGRLLVADFVDPQEVKSRVEAPQTPVTPTSAGPIVPPAPPTSQPQPSPRQHRPQLPPSPPLPPPPPLSNPPQSRERVQLPPPPPLLEKLDPPIVTLDDLFRKTKATPRIYYLPLTEEQVAAKLTAQGKNTRQ